MIKCVPKPMNHIVKTVWWTKPPGRTLDQIGHSRVLEVTSQEPRAKTRTDLSFGTYTDGI